MIALRRIDGVADASSGTPDGVLRATATHSESDDYRDGDGRTIHSSFERRSLGLQGGWTPDDDTRVEPSAIHREAQAAHADRTMDGSVFDRTYAGHIGRAAAAVAGYDAPTTRVNEPGRFVRAKPSMSFDRAGARPVPGSGMIRGMFSYRHAFHAGNHADVLKHVVLVHLLRHLAAKAAPFWVIDTHAGAGLYSLEGEWAAKRGEFAEGIVRVWSRTDAPAPVAEYLDVVRAANPDGALRHYPGSPFIALAHLRPDDRLRLFELHPNEVGVLAGNVAEAGRDAARRTIVRREDGFDGLKALLPPPPRRALVLIDPSYEDKRDYARVVGTLRDALGRFATGCYAIWYPQVQRREPAEMMRRLERQPGLRWVHATLTVRSPPPDGLGLHGSGVFVVNPPWTLEPALRVAMPWLADALAQDNGARWALRGAEDPVRSRAAGMRR